MPMRSDKLAGSRLGARIASGRPRASRRLFEPLPWLTPSGVGKCLPLRKLDRPPRLFGILDSSFVPDVARWIWVIRYAIFCPIALAVLGLTFTRWLELIMQPVLAALAVPVRAGDRPG